MRKGIWREAGFQTLLLGVVLCPAFETTIPLPIPESLGFCEMK